MLSVLHGIYIKCVVCHQLRERWLTNFLDKSRMLEGAYGRNIVQDLEADLGVDA